MPRSAPGSTARLVELCIGYFAFYVITGIMVKYFTALRDPKMSEMAYLFSNTLGGSLIALGVALALGWPRFFQSNGPARWGPLSVPAELAYIIPSGICTAVVIPTTTLMYSLPISVLVAMVIMRGSIIVISRLVDEVQIRQGILQKQVFAEENWAVVFALLAVATNVLLVPLMAFLDARGIPASHTLGYSSASMKGTFDFLHNGQALTIMGLYITAYAIRIYIMNYYKNTRSKAVELDNRGFFAFEQIAASATMAALVAFFFFAPGAFGWTDPRLVDFHGGVAHPDPVAVLSGVPFGIVAFFSVFIFMFKGRTATFAGLVNRLTSLLAGTAATLIIFWIWHAAFPKIAKFPSAQDWFSVLFILVAVGFLTRAEKLRTAEMGLRPTPAPAPELPAVRSAAS